MVGLRQRGCLRVALVLALATLTACTDGTQYPASSTTSDTPREAAVTEDLAEELGIADPPPVAVVRETTPEDHQQALAACLKEAGWAVVVHPDGTIEVGPFTPQQEDSYNTAFYVCAMQYPIADRYTAELTQGQRTLVYEYLRDGFIPCVADLGINLGELPSLEAYLANPSQDWMGRIDGQLQQAVSDGRLAYPNEWLVICPPQPATNVLYGTASLD